MNLTDIKRAKNNVQAFDLVMDIIGKIDKLKGWILILTSKVIIWIYPWLYTLFEPRPKKPITVTSIAHEISILTK